MSQTVNKFLIAGDKVMPEMLVSTCWHLLKTKEEFKTLEKQEIQNIFTEMN